MPLFEARHITASYDREGDRAPLLSDISFTLHEGAIYDLVGPSGSGKSTLLRICALMMEKRGGELFLDGRESAAFAPTAWRRQVCLVPQTSALVPGSIRDNLMLPWKLKVHAGESRPTDDFLQGLLDDAELADVELDRDVSQLSGGQTARVALLRVFATRPRVLLLDEVDAALDDESAHAVGRLTDRLVDTGLTCLRIRHRAADGYAKGVFTLSKEGFGYKAGPVRGAGA